MVKSNPGSRSLRPFVERQRNDLPADHFASHIDLNLLPSVGEFGRHVTHADILFQKRGRTAGGHITNPRSVDEDVLTVTSDAAISYFKSDQLALDAFSFLLLQGFAADEFALRQLRNPAQVRFEQR